jgi:outer membrane protein assembly factor BamB
MERVFLAVFFHCCLGLGVLHADWPQWGGPGRDFSVEDAGLARTWGVNGPTELWSRPLGAGFSALATSGDTLYAHYRRLEAGQAASQETVEAIAASDGATLWRFSYEAPAHPDQEQFGGGTGPHATPLVAGPYIYALGYSGLLHCLDRRDGKLVWTSDLVNDLGATPVQFGFAASPVAYKGTVIVPASGTQGGLAAFDAANGHLLWHSPPATFSYASPVLIQIDGEEQFVLVTGDQIEGIAAVDGSRRWSFAWPEKGQTNVPTPLWLDDEYLLVAGQGAGGALLLRLAAEAPYVEQVWKTARLSYFFSNAVRHGDQIYAGDNFLYGLDWRLGKRLWAERGYKNANLIKVGDLLLLLDEAGTLTLAEIGDSGKDSDEDRGEDRSENNSEDGSEGKGPKVLARTDLFGGDTWTTPTLDGTRLYARNSEILVALDLSAENQKEDAMSPRQARMGLRGAYSKGGVQSVLAYMDSVLQVDLDLLDQLAVVALGRRLLTDGRFDDVAGLIEAGLEVFGRQYVGLELLGWAYLSAGRQAEAVEVWREMQQLKTDEAIASLLRQLDPSVTPTGNVSFALEGYTSARTVTLAGTFNGWDREHTFFRRHDDGWTCRVDLPPGELLYKLVVDGENWILDPANLEQRQDDNGNTNSVLEVGP